MGGVWLTLRRLRSFVRPAPRVAPLTALERAQAVDVCVVGSGPAGASLGLALVERGHRVVMLEGGPARRPFRTVVRSDDAGPGGEIDYPLRSSRYRGLGGTSNLWFGACPRLHPLDFQTNAYTPDGAGWPFAYADLEPYYERAERTLRVHGGPPSEQDPPRRAELPFTAIVDNSALAALMRRAGVAIDNPPLALGRHGGTFRVSEDLLPEFSRHRHATLVCGATVTRLFVDPGGRVEGAEVRDLRGRRAVACARVFVLAGGGLETARLLLLSAPGPGSGDGPLSNGLIGRYFMDHRKVTFRGVLRGSRLSGYGRCHQFYDGFKRRGMGSVLLSVAAEPARGRTALRISADVEMLPAASNRVRLAVDRRDHFGAPALHLAIALSKPDRDTLEQVRSLIRRLGRDLGAADMAEVDGDRGASPWLYHHIGTCRSGLDPARSVVDAELRVHGSPNLYAVGSAVFVTAGGSNPTLTIVALAHRLADHLDGRLRSR